MMKNRKIIEFKGKQLYKILENAPLYLNQDQAPQPLGEIYEAGIHIPTGSIYICNKGAALQTQTSESKKDYLTYHVGFSLLIPNHGLEMVNVGIVGDLKKGSSVVLRPESACAPSFIFGSQRCNCYDQWILARELAADFNPVDLSDLKGKELEEFVSSFFERRGNWVPQPKESGQAFVLIHMDSQNGMGSGALENKYNPYLTQTAFMRHRGEYSAEQIFNTSVAGGFRSIGIPPDPRKLNNNAGYKVPGIILDYLGVDKPVLALTNNSGKTNKLRSAGYEVFPINFFARANGACSLETEDRRTEFGHNIPEGLEISIEQEFERVKKEIQEIESRPWAKSEDHWMRHAIDLAKTKGEVTDKPLVGAVVVDNHVMEGEGYGIQGTHVHAEVMAIDAAKGRAQNSILYTTLEPCIDAYNFPSCTSKIIESGISEVVIGAIDPHPTVKGRGIKTLENAGIKTRIVLEKEANELIKEWKKRWE